MVHLKGFSPNSDDDTNIRTKSMSPLYLNESSTSSTKMLDNF